MNITAMYFSGTGTTKKVTAAIADELTEIKISQDKTAADENPGSIKADIKPCSEQKISILHHRQPGGKSTGLRRMIWWYSACRSSQDGSPTYY